MEDVQELHKKLEQFEKREQELKRRIEELTDFVENASIPLHWVDSNGNIIWANQAELDTLGYTKEEYIGNPISNFHADQEVIEDILMRLTKNETLKNYPARLRCKDNTIKHVLINSNVLVKDGKFVHTRCFSRDITELKQEEERKADLTFKLIEREEHLRLAVQAANLGTFDVDLIKGTMKWDARCRELFGIYTNKEVTYEHDFLNGIHPNDRQQVTEIIEKAYDQSKSDGAYDVEYRTIGAEDQKLRWIRAIGKVFFDKKGAPLRFIGSVLNITEKKQEEIRRNDFIGVISHELKTPLTSIKSYVQVLLAKAKHEGEDFRINALTRTEVQIRKMDTLIKDFLSLARMEEAKIVLNWQLFDFCPMVEEIIEDAYFLTSIHKIHIKNCDVQINADKDKIGQVLSNLVSNAIKYSPHGGDITIGCESVGDKVKIYVRDQGIGINLNEKNRLFERFYRIQDEKADNISGFGVGLYLVSEILKYHDSIIEVESKEGEGSTFYFMLDTVSSLKNKTLVSY